MTHLTPRSQALAFRVWQVADPEGWDMTHAEIAEALGVSTGRVRAVCGLKGWSSRVRASEPSKAAQAGARARYDDFEGVGTMQIDATALE